MELWDMGLLIFSVKLATASIPLCPGLMFPSSGDIHVAPFSDEQLYFEHYAQASFWSLSHTHIHTRL